ncbi:MAG: TonB-dependent receptor plug domain-containing protein, partial [Bacteroidales bacterium]|nr:TonB-dependent receptor plug domain-containing protein [Bacteroidales bacterium]
MKRFVSLMVLCMMPLALLAQHTVSGTVTEEGNGAPLVGVGVLVAGTNTGTTTDLDGNYSVNVPANGTLSFEYIGFTTVTVAVDGQSTINVQMKEDTFFLDEVVVVGYSVMKRRDVLGAVSKVDGKELAKLPTSSVQQSMQGRIAGVNVTSETGAPGAGISVRVRGTGSISSSNEPLYIVDGIPVEGALNTLAASDIEEISVLKDASSAAIYGSRATNGVVLITTKSGKE